MFAWSAVNAKWLEGERFRSMNIDAGPLLELVDFLPAYHRHQSEPIVLIDWFLLYQSCESVGISQRCGKLWDMSSNVAAEICFYCTDVFQTRCWWCCVLYCLTEQESNYRNSEVWRLSAKLCSEHISCKTFMLSRFNHCHSLYMKPNEFDKLI